MCFLGPIETESIQRLDLLAVATELVSVRIAAAGDDALTEMQEQVIVVVLADNEVSVLVVQTIAVNVMNFRARRQSVTKSTLRDQHMLK